MQIAHVDPAAARRLGRVAELGVEGHLGAADDKLQMEMRENVLDQPWNLAPLRV